MLAQRRWFASPAWADDATTGRELFGMIWLVCTRESQECQTSLGISLARGHMARIDKLMAFFWVLILVCCSLGTMESVLHSTRSFTIDQGVEAGMPLMGIVIRDFAARHGLKPSEEILKRSRTFPLSTDIHDAPSLVRVLEISVQQFFSAGTRTSSCSVLFFFFFRRTCVRGSARVGQDRW